MAEHTLLVVRALNVSYGDSKVVFDASLDVGQNQIVSCVGRNGAGKTTLVKTIGGFLKPTDGQILYRGADVRGMPSYDVAKMGLRYIAQDKKVFSDLTVAENLELASYATGDRDWEPVLNFFPKLRELLDRKAGYLSGGERQMLMIGRAILGDPHLLLVDEPTEGLAPSIVEQLCDIFLEISKRCALIVVEQNLSLVSRISDKVYAMKEGRIVSEVTEPDDIKNVIFEKYL